MRRVNVGQHHRPTRMRDLSSVEIDVHRRDRRWIFEDRRLEGEAGCGLVEASRLFHFYSRETLVSLRRATIVGKKGGVVMRARVSVPCRILGHDRYHVLTRQ